MEHAAVDANAAYTHAADSDAAAVAVAAAAAARVASDGLFDG